MSSGPTLFKQTDVAPAIRVTRTSPRRGLNREEAALYIGVGATKFDQLIREGKMPEPRKIDGRRVWDVRELDSYFDALPSAGTAAGTSWDDAA